MDTEIDKKTPQSLVNEFISRRKDGEKLRSSLKNSIFQAKTAIGNDQEFEDEQKLKIQLWKVNMRGLDDNEPV